MGVSGVSRAARSRRAVHSIDSSRVVPCCLISGAIRRPEETIHLTTSRSLEDQMIILRQRMRSKSERADDVLAALAAIIPGARATQGVISLDIARDLLDPDSFVATGIYEDGAALKRQESAPEVHRAMAMLSEALAAPPDRTIYDASRDPALVC